MSRILFLSQVLPFPADAGPKVRSYYVLRRLAQQHQVTLLAFSRPDDKPEAEDHLRRFCSTVHTIPLHRTRRRDAAAMAGSLLGSQPFIIRRDYLPAMAAKIDQLLSEEKFDAVHSDQLWMAQYALHAANKAPGIKLVLDEHNACYQIFQRLALGERNPIKRLLLEREWRLMKRYEAQTCSRFEQVAAVTGEDRAILEGLVVEHNRRRKKETGLSPAGLPRFTTIPICVDARNVQPVVPAAGSKNVLHLGTMFWLPNIEGVLWFAKEVWPRVLDRAPEATFTIAGKNPPNEIKRLSTAQGLSRGAANIQVTGYVPDPAPVLQAAGAFVVPLLSGGGMRVKILDAWAWGLPVISTSIGAEGIKYRHGENILIADEAEAFAAGVVRLLCEPDLAGRLRENGRRWLETHYDVAQVYEAWDRIYE